MGAVLAALGMTGTPARAQTPPSLPAAAAGYRTVAGDDWRRYRDAGELRATGYFWWSRRDADVHDQLELVPDALFGRALRVRFPRSEETGFAPRLSSRLPAPLSRMWFRWRIRFDPGWTTVGPSPAGYANSWKMASWTWEGMRLRGGVQISNVDEYVLEWGVADPATGRTAPIQSTVLPGSAPAFGRVGTAWTDGEWYEFVVYYERISASAARQYFGRRRLTRAGRMAPDPFVWVGLALSGEPMPRVEAVHLGMNRNKSTPAPMHLRWGPWEVVDGSAHPNPWNLSLPSAAAAGRRAGT